MQMGSGSLGDLARLREGVKRMRVSSYDTSGANDDRWAFQPGQTRVIADITGAGCIKHIWMTMASPDPLFARKAVLRMWWDGEETPSVEAPIGDLFGIGHGIVKNFWSLPLTMSPSHGRGWNCFFPMPFADGARIEVTNETGEGLYHLYFYIDYEEYEDLGEEYGRFHAQWRRQNPTPGYEIGERQPIILPTEDGGFQITPYGMKLFSLSNLDGKGNYVILEAEGKGHYVGCNLNIDCFQREKNDWYGEGDDMIWIDQDEGDWPPRLHGTGTEDYFNTAYCPAEEFCTPYHGLTVYSGANIGADVLASLDAWSRFGPDAETWMWAGKNSVYRFHIEDPIYFEKSIKVTIEHGHANTLSNDYSSTAYWYQTEPHKPFPEFPSVEERLPH